MGHTKKKKKDLKTIGDFLNDFGGWKMKIILVVLYKNFGYKPLNLVI
jgi:hypothetical protein